MVHLLGEVRWDFAYLQMCFQFNRVEYQFHGLENNMPKLEGNCMIKRAMDKRKQGFLIQLCSIEGAGIEGIKTA